MLFWVCLAIAPFAAAQDFTINLKETDIQELIKFVAEATDTTIVVDPGLASIELVAISPTGRTGVAAAATGAAAIR